jgi:long-chain fatty acid transport protein
MGAAAVGWVDDPSALYHNPAGLAQTEHGNVLGSFSPVIVGFQASPNEETREIQSTPTFGPLFLVGGSYRISDRLTAGVGVFPVGSSAGEYSYDGIKEDSFQLVFAEITPGIGIDLTDDLRLGLGYRATYGSANRLRQKESGLKEVEFNMSGFDFFGFRAGLQWEPTDEVQLGVTYRTRVDVELTGDEGEFLGAEFSNWRGDFTIPSRLKMGGRWDIGSLAIAQDLEYAFTSQNEVTKIKADGFSGSLTSRFDWSDAIASRTGLEYGLMDDAIKPRVGYMFDGQFTNETYPTQFGTPPGNTHSITAGCGFEFENWETSVGYAYRFGSGQAPERPDDYDCDSCSYPGEHKITIHNISVDASYRF